MSIGSSRRRLLSAAVKRCWPTADTLFVVLLLVLSSAPHNDCRRPGDDGTAAGRPGGGRRAGGGNRGSAQRGAPPPCPSDACRCRWSRSPIGGAIARCSPTADRTTLPELFDATTDNTSSVYAALHVVRANLTELPADGFRNVGGGARLLDLTGNRFVRPTDVSSAAFAGRLETTLGELVLTGCGLTGVPTAALGRLAVLGVLRLDDNAIGALPANAFSFAADGSSSLRQLYLSRNSIGRVDARAFVGLAGLDKLSLSDNEIDALPAGTLAALVNLTGLDVGRNRLTALGDGWLDGLAALQWLELESNRIAALGPRTFRGAPRLVGMRAENNALATIDDDSFGALVHLNYLSIDLSNVTRLTTRTLAGLRRLRTLNLGELRRSAALMPDGFFAPLRRLKYLSLADNDGLLTDDAMVRPAQFGAGFRFRSLNVWLEPIRGCRCSAPWIRRLGGVGAYVHGFCPDKRPLSCPAGGKPAVRKSADKHENAQRLRRRKYKSGI